MNRVLVRMVAIALLHSIGLTAKAEPSAPGQGYFDLLGESASKCHSQMPMIVTAAEETAKRLIAGGRLYLTGDGQHGFAAEALGRAGGLMCVKQLGRRRRTRAAQGDVVLMGMTGAINVEQGKAIEDLRAAGVYVIAFARKGGPAEPNVLPDVLIATDGPPGLTVEVGGEKKLCPIDSVVNVINLWVWTGEVASACTRQGKMPVFYRSYGLPGGREWAAKYKNKTFHDDLTVEPVEPNVLGRAYLDAIKTRLLHLSTTQMPALTKAAHWWRDVQTRERAVAIAVGHLFPAHFLDDRGPQMITMQQSWDPEKLKTKFRSDQFVFLCGYQEAPKRLLDQALAVKFKFVYLTVKSAQPPEPGDNIIYLNPGWPLPDACISVPGYDVPILPASGVINAAVYWALLAQRANLANASDTAKSHP